MTLRSLLLPVAFLAALPAFAAHADDTSPICTDRPTKANAPCTVPQGSWQLETDAGNATHDARPGSRTDTLYVVNPYLKYGIGAHTDIEVNWAPAVRVRTRIDGDRHTTHGSGDLYVRVKTALYSGDVFSASIIPFVKAPTASHGIGNDHWEGGLAAPMSMAAGAGFTVTIGPELDALADADGHGRHLAMTHLVNVAHPLSSTVSVAVEYWRQDNRDPSGHVKQESADIAFTWLPRTNLQLDVGANIGVNDATPDRQIYAGLSYRW
ncbi:MAG TPA: transporter [Luteibacter sp.]|uniref:transporter n=1 Tax=Luteibacter sp. TaxID=1886636 RepID=UPI002C46D9D3|nr:transporter [Luteibacter sp.]HVI56860.1 transporter [Luteibacter sp.]